MVLRFPLVLLCPQNSARMWERAVLTNRPLLDLSPFVLEGLRAWRGAWDRPGVFLNPNSCRALEPEPSKEGSWMMAQMISSSRELMSPRTGGCLHSFAVVKAHVSQAPRKVGAS